MGKDKLKNATVTVMQADRLKAITELSIAIRNVAESLREAPVVNITGCHIENCEGNGIDIRSESPALEEF